MGGKKKTVHHTTKVPNDYDDAWIRSKFGDVDRMSQQFATWQAGREASLGREQAMRDEFRRDISGLTAGQAGMQANIGNLQAGGQQLQSAYAGLSQSHQQQMKDLYNLASQEGGGVYGVQTDQGLTFTRPRAGGTAGLNRQQLQTQSLNV